MRARDWIALVSIIGLGGAATYARFRREMAKAARALEACGTIVETCAGPIEYAREGEGEPVLVIHGAGGGYDQGLSIGQDTVGFGYDLVAVALPGEPPVHLGAEDDHVRHHVDPDEQQRRRPERLHGDHLARDADEEWQHLERELHQHGRERGSRPHRPQRQPRIRQPLVGDDEEDEHGHRRADGLGAALRPGRAPGGRRRSGPGPVPDRRHPGPMSPPPVTPAPRGTLAPSAIMR